MSEKIQQKENTKFRRLTSCNRWVQLALLTALILMGVLFIMGIDTYLGFAIFKQQYCGAFIGICLSLIFLGARPTERSTSDRVPWYDYILAVVGLAVGLYMTVEYPDLVVGKGMMRSTNIFVSAAFILLILEAIRRLQGWIIVIVIIILVLYARFANLFPGLFYAPPTYWATLLTYLYLDPNSMLFLLGIAATIAFAFVLFSQILFVYGGVKFIQQFCYVLVGRYRGAPAKVAVVASSLFGTITGGAVANVLVTGSFTIPMMKEAGFRPRLAAAIEAVSSCGGQIMPPVMGISAFIIAEFLGISYSKIAIAAIIPALLYYVALFVQIDLSAAKSGIRGISAELRPPMQQVIRNSWLFFMPVAILIYFLFFRKLQAATAGTITFLLSIIIVSLSKDNRHQFWKKFLNMMERSMRVLLNVTVILVGAGFIVGALCISGLASTFGSLLIDASGGNLILLLILAAMGCILLGMGMPTTAAYIMVAVVIAPALIEMKIVPVAAHLFIFYFAVIANFTPPVAIAAYAAASLANTNAIQTGFTALRLGLLSYIIPFLFVLSPALIFEGTTGQIILVILSALLGTVLLGVGLSGYLFQKLSLAKRLLAVLAAGSFFFPLLNHTDMGWVSYLVGIVATSSFLTIELFRRKAA
ncbi:TRAP transporter permease [Thermodesulfobacteriota bacterium]